MDGRLVIAVMVVVGAIFVLLNLLLGGGPSGLRVLSSPRSSPVGDHRSHEVRLLSRCAPTVDFDGSFWAPPGGWSMSRPAEPATVTLVSDDRAVLRLATGQRIRLERLGSTIRLSPCGAPTP